MKGGNRAISIFPFYFAFGAPADNNYCNRCRNFAVISSMRQSIAFAILLTAAVTAGCTFTQKVRTGMQAYEVKQYAVAIEFFELEYAEIQNPTDKARIAFLTGESYRSIGDLGAAGNWYRKAYDDGYGDAALELYANALKQQERYEEALVAYEALYKANPNNTSYRSNIALCRQAMEWSRSPVAGYVIQPASFNSTSADYSPQPIGPGKVLFTSDRSARTGDETYLWTGRSFSDLFVSNSGSPQITEYDGVLNSKDNEGTAVIAPDGLSIVFTRCYVDETYDAWCQLMISFKKGFTWSEPEKLPFVREKINYGHPAFSANGSTLFFSSDDPAGQGGHDLYFSQPDGQGGWSEPVNLGPMINTSGQEQYPTVYRDTLFYSSDRLAGLGGLDIFKTYLDITHQWVSPINLKAPINSGADDFGYVVDTFAVLHDGEIMKGFFTSSREGSGRSDDIFAFTLVGEKFPDEVALTEEEEEEKPQAKIDYQVFLAIKVMEPVYEIADDPNSKVIGQRPLPNGPVVISESNTEQKLVSDTQGQLLHKLSEGKSYNIMARYRDHLSAAIDVSTEALIKDPEQPIITISKTILLDPIIRNKEIILENIFYDYDQWFIRNDAKPSLDELAVIMKNNPSIRIELASHTDCRGTDEYNLDLSQKRAQAAVDYLTSVGIDNARLQAQGFGERFQAVTCECESCTEDQHQKNRRTTFKIIN